MEALKRIESDCTFDQMSYKEKILHESGPFYSYDLKSATDLMPVSLQVRIVSSLLGSEKASAWYNIMVGYGFDNDESSDSIFYKTGQPMGAYSSWAMMSLTHHLIVHTAAKRSASPLKYVLLGDDIVIVGDSLAAEYRKIVESLGMEINLQKTLISTDSFEFVKRFHSRGTDLSALPIGSLLHARTQYWLWGDFLKQSLQRGFTVSSEFDGLEHLFKLLGVSKQRKRVYLVNQVKNFFTSIDPYEFMSRDDFKAKAIKHLKLDYPFSCNIRSDYVFSFLMELLLHCQLEDIHKNVVTSVKNFNNFSRSEPLLAYKARYGHVHPLVGILHSCAKDLQQVEYSVSSNPVEEQGDYIRSKVKVKDFSFIPNDITKVVSVRGHVKNLLSRVNANRDLINVLRSLDGQMKLCEPPS
jgi:hypothetical protein